MNSNNLSVTAAKIGLKDEVNNSWPIAGTARGIVAYRHALLKRYSEGYCHFFFLPEGCHCIEKRDGVLELTLHTKQRRESPRRKNARRWNLDAMIDSGIANKEDLEQTSNSSRITKWSLCAIVSINILVLGSV